ncbi:type IV secretory pathway VirB10-like protein [Nitrobacter vulgaris]|nr:type IV secretory pathway VirB10-like protein [Nitrobacter vulgaris]
MATAALLIGIGFGGGILLGRAALEPVQHASQPKLAAKSLPAARVVLPAPTEMAPSPPAPASAPLVQAATTTTLESQPTSPQDHSHIASVNAIESARQAEHRRETEKKAEAAERRKKAAERDRHKRYVEKKPQQEAALEQQAQEQRQQAHKPAGPFGLLAFDDGAERVRPTRASGCHLESEAIPKSG